MRRMVLETKYGKIIKARPVTSGTTVFCRLPYTKKASPIEPKSRPHKRVEVFIATPERLTFALRRAERVLRAKGTPTCEANAGRRLERIVRCGRDHGADYENA
jgi:hypothetical protein